MLALSCAPVVGSGTMGVVSYDRTRGVPVASPRLALVALAALWLAASCSAPRPPDRPGPRGPEPPSGPLVTRVFVASEAINRVLVVDPERGQVVAEYRTESRPARLLVSADGRRLYVAHHEAKVLLALDAASGR